MKPALNRSILAFLLLAVPLFFMGCPRLPAVFEGGELPRFLQQMSNDPPVTTSFADAVTEEVQLDSFNPPDDLFFPMAEMPRGEDGSYRLEPGLYRLDAKGYCIKAGTYGPSKGSGYLYAPLQGPKADIVRSVLQRSADQPNIPQQDVQVLLWAIIARAKLSDMPEDRQQTARQLLTLEELFNLNGGALGLIPNTEFRNALGKMPEEIRKVYEAEQDIRRLLTTDLDAPYEELERLAVLTGTIPEKHKIRDIPSGRWSYHPDGYFVRYLPSGYSRMRYEVFVPTRIERDATGKITSLGAGKKGGQLVDRPSAIYFHPTRNVAVPANTMGQRLVSGGVPQQKPAGLWHEILPDCPCTWDQVPKGKKQQRQQPDKNNRMGEWNKATTHQEFHPGACNTVRWARLTPGGSGQQCTYDNNGNLITSGLGAGTPDLVSPEYWQDIWKHSQIDVAPFKDERVSCDEYFQRFPPNQGSGCPPNPVNVPPAGRSANESCTAIIESMQYDTNCDPPKKKGKKK